jgi:hypothetical protein
MRILAAGLAVFALFLAACQGPKIKPEHRLAVAVSPLLVGAGQRVTVTAMAVDQAEMAYVSGTVGSFGLPNVALKYDAVGKLWFLSRPIPLFVTIPAGRYEIKAWGESKAGEKYERNTFVEIK